MLPQPTRKYARMFRPMFHGWLGVFLSFEGEDDGQDGQDEDQTIPGAAIYALYASCVPCPFGWRWEICAPDKFQAQKVHENAILFSKNTDAHSGTCRPQDARHQKLSSWLAVRMGSDRIGLVGVGNGVGSWVDQRRRCPIGYEMMRFRPGRLIGNVGLLSDTVGDNHIRRGSN